MSDTSGFREIPAGEYLASAGDHQREPHEFATGSVARAVNIPLGELPERASELDPQRPVALLCRSGNRSRHAAAHLTQRGFTDVINLAGGVLALDLDRPTGTTHPGGS
jgi:rhodanese-related sulfurtransferase